MEAQLVLRDLVAALPVDDLLTRRGELSSQVRAGSSRAAMLGVELETVGSQGRDVPGSDQAGLRAGGGSAQGGTGRGGAGTRGDGVLRQLANAARMLESNPALVTMKTLQAVSNGKNTIVLGAGTTLLPVDRDRGARRAEPPATSRRSSEGDTDVQ